MQLVKLGYVLLEEVFVAAIVILEDHLVPLLADPALHSVHPVCAFLDLFVTKDAREDDLLHVASHRILHEQVVRDLIDTHEHESKLTCRAVFLLLDHLNLSFDPLTLRAQLLHLLEEVDLLLRLLNVLLLDWITEHLEHLLAEICDAFNRIKLFLDFIMVSFEGLLHSLLLRFDLSLSLHDLVDKLLHRRFLLFLARLIIVISIFALLLFLKFLSVWLRIEGVLSVHLSEKILDLDI